MKKKKVIKEQVKETSDMNGLIVGNYGKEKIGVPVINIRGIVKEAMTIDRAKGILNIKEEFVLPKWPAFIVKGKKVTKTQAQEIIIRTDSFDFSTNDREFKKELYQALGFKLVKSDTYQILTEEQEKELESLKKDLKLLNSNYDTYLQYLDNHQICTSWVGGPKGWCHFDGYIGTNNYNIGKWPKYDEVLREWKVIAKEFPFLSLKCQLFSGETSEEGQPIIEYKIENGEVTYYKPIEVLDYPHESRDVFMNPGGERGCTIEEFRDAVALVQNKYGIANKTW